VSAQAPLVRSPFDLRDYLSIARRRKWIILVPTVLVAFAALGWSLTRSPTYTSTASVLVKPVNDPFAPQAPVGSTVDMDTERAVASASVVTGSTAQTLGIDPKSLPDVLAVRNPANTQILEFTFSSSTAQGAQKGADAFALAYISYKKSQAQEALDTERNQLQTQIGVDTAQLRTIDAAVARTGTTTAEQQAQQTTLGQSINTHIGSLATLNSVIVDPGDVIQPAQIPTHPSSPRPTLALAAGLFVGLIIGLGIALVRERLDDRPRDLKDLELRSGLEVMGTIPKASRGTRRAAGPRTPSSEAYRALRASVRSGMAQRGAHSLAVTSAFVGEGKSSTVANLGVALSHAGSTVILVSADMYRPRLHEFFGTSNEQGLAEVLDGKVNLSSALVNVQGDSLRLLCSGTTQGRAGSMGSDAFRELVDRMADMADFVIVDTPAVAVASDVLSLSTSVDSVLLVVSASTTTLSAVNGTKDRLEQVGATILGTVLTKVDKHTAEFPQPAHQFVR
jgi:polysaccharide biosynthesis transport protein